MFDSSNNRGGDRADFLIVGGGAAGSVLGERLSEDSSVRVLLLEAGPDYAATRDVPQDLLDADQFPSSHDWGYQSEPGVLGRSIPVARAKVIGGSSAHNGAVAGRGTPEDYDEWSQLGNPGGPSSSCSTTSAASRTTPRATCATTVGGVRCRSAATRTV